LALHFLASGSFNTAEGYQALFVNSDGANNTAVGAKALKKSLGTKNIAIGYQAGVSLINGNNNIYIGNQGAGDESQTIRIGTAQPETFIAGINVAGVSGTAVVVNRHQQRRGNTLLFCTGDLRQGEAAAACLGRDRVTVLPPL